MYLNDFDLQQLDEARLSELTAGQKEELLRKAVADLKEARERLKADSRTSSRPPSSDAPWLSASDTEEAESEAAEAQATGKGEPKKPAGEGPGAGEQPAAAKRPGRRVGSPGHSRSEKLAVTETIEHGPECCALCGQSLGDRPFTARTGLYVLELEPFTSPLCQDSCRLELK